MATRVYLGNIAPGYTPPTKQGDWDSSASTTIGKLAGKAGVAATIGVAESSTTNPFDVFLGRWVSDGFNAANDFAGTETANWIIGVLESATTANDFFHVHIYITTGDTD